MSRIEYFYVKFFRFSFNFLLLDRFRNRWYFCRRCNFVDFLRRRRREENVIKRSSVMTLLTTFFNNVFNTKLIHCFFQS